MSRARGGGRAIRPRAAAAGARSSGSDEDSCHRSRDHPRSEQRDRSVDDGERVAGASDMIWAILALLGVPLWFCAIAIGTVVFRNRRLRRRPGSVPVRVLVPGKTRWSAGHGVWVSDVFAWRGSPAAWREDLVQVGDASARVPEAEVEKRLHRIGDHPVVATFVLADGGTLDGGQRGRAQGRAPRSLRRRLERRRSGGLPGSLLGLLRSLSRRSPPRPPARRAPPSRRLAARWPSSSMSRPAEPGWS